MSIKKTELRQQQKINEALYPLIDGYAWNILKRNKSFSLLIVKIPSVEYVTSRMINDNSTKVTLKKIREARDKILNDDQYFNLVEDKSIILNHPAIGDYVYSKEENKNVWVPNVHSTEFYSMDERNKIAELLPMMKENMHWSIRKSYNKSFYNGRKYFYQISLQYGQNGPMYLFDNRYDSSSLIPLKNLRLFTLRKFVKKVNRDEDSVLKRWEIKQLGKIDVQADIIPSYVGYYVNKKAVTNLPKKSVLEIEGK